MPNAASPFHAQGTFAAGVHVPDVYGVFKWVVDYRRPGYSWVQLEQQVRALARGVASPLRAACA